MSTPRAHQKPQRFHELERDPALDTPQSHAAPGSIADRRVRATATFMAGRHCFDLRTQVGCHSIEYIFKRIRRCANEQHTFGSFATLIAKYDLTLRRLLDHRPNPTRLRWHEHDATRDLRQAATLTTSITTTSLNRLVLGLDFGPIIAMVILHYSMQGVIGYGENLRQQAAFFIALPTATVATGIPPWHCAGGEQGIEPEGIAINRHARSALVCAATAPAGGHASSTDKHAAAAVFRILHVGLSTRWSSVSTCHPDFKNEYPESPTLTWVDCMTGQSDSDPH